MADILQINQRRPKPEATVCTQCVHFINREPDSPREHVWYNHLCEATPLPTKVGSPPGLMGSQHGLMCDAG